MQGNQGVNARAGRLDWLWIAILALLPVPVWVAAGYGGHDFLYHAASWSDLSQAWKAHQWQLGWAGGAQFGYGEPRFSFYPPLSFLIGAGLLLLLPIRIVPGLVGWAVLAIAGISMWIAWGRLIGNRRRLTASLLYLSNWYLLSTVLFRYAIAEAWVLAFLPLLFLFFYRASIEKRVSSVPALAILLSLAWLLNIPTSIVSFYGLGSVAAIAAWQNRSLRPLLFFAGAEILALAMAAFRIAPAFLEANTISPQGLTTSLDPRNTMLFHYIPPPRAEVYYYDGSALAIGLLLLAGVWGARRIRSTGLRWMPFVCFLVFAIFLEEPLSIPVWMHVPELRYVSFAFRFLSLASLTAIFLVLTPEIGRRIRAATLAVMLLASLAPFYLFFHSLFPVLQRFPDVTASQKEWARGYEGVHEYVPNGVPASVSDRDAELATFPRPLIATASCQAAVLNRDENRITIRTSAGQPCSVVLNVFWFPRWQAAPDSGAAVPVARSASGLLKVSVPAGPHTLELAFVPGTPIRTAGDLVSLISLTVVVTLLILATRSQRSRREHRRLEGNVVA